MFFLDCSRSCLTTYPSSMSTSSAASTCFCTQSYFHQGHRTLKPLSQRCALHLPPVEFGSRLPGVHEFLPGCKSSTDDVSLASVRISIFWPGEIANEPKLSAVEKLRASSEHSMIPCSRKCKRHRRKSFSRHLNKHRISTSSKKKNRLQRTIAGDRRSPLESITIGSPSQQGKRLHELQL